MHRIKLDRAPASVQKFVRALPLSDDGVELELDGTVLCKVVSPHVLTDAEQAALIERGRELVRRARKRNQGVPARAIEREVRQAVEEVRRRKQR
jgi:hypothetical protein